ncbi:serine/threonine-protein kinase [Streptomyces sp. NPDC093546]|uniref:serine/threonine-protein kinase n=1 Tax=Streptomyces sp. NPDC093546 TaxID=3366040 RepID=UPI0038212BC6
MNPLEFGDPVRLGPYRLLGVLGEGGMGKVYVGQDGEGRAAAVKVLHPHLSHDENLAQRFVREARMAQAVSSPGVARVLDARTEGGRPWIASEFLTGPTLEQAVHAHGPLDEPAVRALAEALARTLHDIHAAGLVHRDLKPANIVLTSGGPRVIDFGIARPEHGLTLTTTGQVPVTPGYGAPEQVLGHRVGPSADVFSLGAVLVHAASGQRAYEGANIAAVQYEVVHGAARLDRVPAALVPLIGPCLAKDPAARPTPRDLVRVAAPPRGADRVWRHGPIAQDITTRELGLRTLTSTVPGAAAQAPRSVSRRRLLTTAAAGGAVLAAGGAAAVWWSTRPRRTNELFDIPPAVKAPMGRLLDATKGDFVIGQSPEPLWTHKDALAEESPGPLPVGDVVVAGTADGGVTAYGVVDGKRRWTAPEARAVHRYASLSDRLVAGVDGDGTLLTFVASTGQPKWTAPAEASSILGVDDDAVYVATEDNRVRAVGRSDGRLRWTVRLDTDLRREAQPRGTVSHGHLAVTTKDGDVTALDTRDGRTVWNVRQESDERVETLASGRTLFLSGHRFRAVDITTGKQQWIADLARQDGTPMRWGPPAVHGGHVYVAALGFPLRFDVRSGKTVEWTWGLLPEGHPRTPLVLQGNGFWMIEVDGTRTEAGVSVRHREDSTGTTWGFRGLRKPDRCWMVGDAYRVFVRDSTTLTALPVF